jgi:signal transduction histidine kinase
MTIAIIPGFVTLLIVIATFLAMRALEESRHWVEHTRDIIETSNSLLTRMVDAETGERAYIVAGDPQFLEPYTGAQNEVESTLSRLQQLTHDNPSQQGRLHYLDTLIREQFSAFGKAIQLRDTNGLHAAAVRLETNKQKMDQVRAVLAQINAEEQQLLAARDTREHRNRQFAIGLISIGGLAAVLIALFANRALAGNIGALDEANAELAQQAQRLEEQATELESQAAELEATATELEAANVELEEQTTVLEEQRDVAHAARVDAEQANAAKSRFLSTMSHELRTPLNAVTGYIDLMDAEVHGPITVEQREDIRRIKRAVAQLTSVINDILNFAKLEAGEVTYDIRPVQVHEALANASALMEPQAVAKGIAFSYISCDADLVVCADRERLQQIVLNLLSNAVKYTARGGSVTLHCDTLDTETILISVSDTGRGISPENVARIFDPFVQLLDSAHAPSDGVGLGLAIGRDLARGMGGDITVTSRVGEGSVFTLLLPVSATDPSTPERVARFDPASRMASRSDSPQPPQRPAAS